MDSDYDLLVIVDDSVLPAQLGWRQCNAARAGFSADIIPCRAGTLAERGRAIGSFVHQILIEGVVVYEHA